MGVRIVMLLAEKHDTAAARSAAIVSKSENAPRLVSNTRFGTGPAP
jgi:hypothetical protein